MKALRGAIAGVLLTACAAPPSAESVFGIKRDELNELRLAYASDYVSFVGRDERGAVAFALDANRGQDGDTWQAEHFVVLHDEGSGWQHLLGNGSYPNHSRSLEVVPDSPTFSFQGTPTSGWHILSDANALTLAVEPIVLATTRQVGLAVYRLGSAAATLSWSNRSIQGRAIYEYLFLPAFNRLSRTYLGTFDDFQGLYLSIEGRGDLYLHQQAGRGFQPLIEAQEGFMAWQGAAAPLTSIEVQVTDRETAAGFYRWPVSWRGAFSALGTPYRIRLQLDQRETIANWVLGGFAMGIVRGTLETPNGQLALYGLGELIM